MPASEGKPGYDVAIKFIWLHNNDSDRMNNAITDAMKRDSDVWEIPSSKTKAV